MLSHPQMGTNLYLCDLPVSSTLRLHLTLEVRRLTRLLSADDVHSAVIDTNLYLSASSHRPQGCKRPTELV